MDVGYLWESQKKKRPVEKPRRKWVDNIEMNLREIGWNGMDGIDLAQRWGPVDTVMNFRVP
jgi:hypothetical protein